MEYITIISKIKPFSSVARNDSANFFLFLTEFLILLPEFCSETIVSAAKLGYFYSMRAYRHYGLILVFLLSAGKSFCEEAVGADFLRGLNASINQNDILGNNNREGLLFFPGAYYSKKYKTYAGLGFMIDSIEMMQEYDDDDEQILRQADTLMRLALFLRRSKTNLTLLFNYQRDKSWGINFKIRL